MQRTKYRLEKWNDDRAMGGRRSEKCDEDHSKGENGCVHGLKDEV
jgi:hypothetical protein